MTNKRLILKTFTFAVAFTMAVASCHVFRKDNTLTEQTEDTIPVVENTRWGIHIDNYEILEGEIANGQVLSKLLLQYGIGSQKVSQLADASEDVFSVRKLRAGNKYYVLQTTVDSLPRADWFIYKISPTEHAVYSLQDSVYCYRDTLATDTTTNCIRGKITSSLWNAMIEQGADPNLAGKLSDVYSWTIDFFGVQKNDSFCVYYQDLVVDDSIRVGLGRILASNFITGGKDHFAFRYDYKEGRGDYFDETGASLQRAFLKAPLSYSRISSTFSNGRMHPILKTVRAHHGVDYAAPAGTPVYSVGDGVVITKAWDNNGGGNYLKIKHNAIYTTEYMHLKGFAQGIQQGVHVKQGQVIGYVGSTGLSTGPHLDYRVFKNGTAINPLRMDLPAIDPIDKEDMPAYIEAVKPLMDMIGCRLDTVYQTAPTDTL